MNHFILKKGIGLAVLCLVGAGQLGCLDTDGEIQGTVGGSSAVGAASSIVVSSDPAIDYPSPEVGQVAFNSTTGQLEYYDGSSWVPAGGSGSIGAGSITGTELAAGSVDSSHIVDGSIGSSDLAAGAVNTAALADGSVTLGKISSGCNDTEILVANASGDLACSAAPAGDNLGNHTATQNLDLGANLLVGNGGSAGIAIAASGNVGVGTTSPGEKLNIRGANNLLGITSTGGNGNEVDLISVEASDNSQRFVWRFTPEPITFSDRLTLDANAGGAQDIITYTGTGNVGIGTTTPSSILHVGQNFTGQSNFITLGKGFDSSSGLNWERAGGIVDTSIYSTLDEDLVFETDITNSISDNHFIFRSGGSELLRITDAGNVGIGTSSPTRKLDVTNFGRIRGNDLVLNVNGVDNAANLEFVTIAAAVSFAMELRGSVRYTNVINIAAGTYTGDITIVGNSRAIRLVGVSGDPSAVVINGRVNVAGNSRLVEMRDLSIDTPAGTAFNCQFQSRCTLRDVNVNAQSGSGVAIAYSAAMQFIDLHKSFATSERIKMPLTLLLFLDKAFSFLFDNFSSPERFVS